MRTRTLSSLVPSLAIALVTGVAVVGGCAQNQRYSQNDTASITIDPSSTSIVVGETVTVVAHTKDTYGQDAKVEWTCTGGKISTEQNGRVARVRFDDVGTYSIRALLKAQGRDIESSMVEIHVRPVR